MRPALVLVALMLGGCPIASDDGSDDTAFIDPTPVLGPVPNRFIGRYTASFDTPTGIATFPFVVTSRRPDGAGGLPDAGGVLESTGLPGVAHRVGQTGNFDPRYGSFLTNGAGANVRGNLPASGTNDGTSFGPMLLLTSSPTTSYVGTITRDTAPLVGLDDRVIHVDQASSDCNVTTGDFPQDLFKYLWLFANSYPQTKWYASIRNGAAPARLISIRSLDIADATYAGVVNIGNSVNHPVESPTSLSYLEVVDGGLNKQWDAVSGRVVIDLADLTQEALTVHFENLVMAPVESSGATGTFRLQFSGTTTNGDNDLNAPGAPEFQD